MNLGKFIGKAGKQLTFICLNIPKKTKSLYIPWETTLI